jgi:uncharacterized membrane protein
MAHPFDPRSVILARHAQHVVLIHFPIALFLVGVLFELISRLRPSPHLATAAQLNLTAAAVCIIPAYVTGFLAWQLALEGQRLKGLLLYHLIASSISTALVITAWWLRSRTQLRPIFVLIVELAGALSISLTAHLGGFLSGVNN